MGRGRQMGCEGGGWMHTRGMGYRNGGPDFMKKERGGGGL